MGGGVKYQIGFILIIFSCQDTVLENRVDPPQDGVQLYGVEMGNVQTHIHVQNNKHVQQDQFDVENKSTIKNEVQQMADVQLQNEVQQMTDVQLQNEVQQLNESNLLPNNLEKQQNQKVSEIELNFVVLLTLRRTTLGTWYCQGLMGRNNKNLNILKLKCLQWISRSGGSRSGGSRSGGSRV